MDKMGSGIGNKLTAEQERKVVEDVIKNYKPRGTHTLGPLFSSKHGAKKNSNDE
jgi:hypothetical protein